MQPELKQPERRQPEAVNRKWTTGIETTRAHSRPQGVQVQVVFWMVQKDAGAGFHGEGRSYVVHEERSDTYRGKLSSQNGSAVSRSKTTLDWFCLPKSRV